MCVMYCLHVALNDVNEYFFPDDPDFDYFFFSPITRPVEKIRLDLLAHA